MTTIARLKVKILGSGNAAGKHRLAYESLPDLYQIVDSGTPDIVDICTPNALHFQQASEALKSGCHAIVEKPVCASLAEIAEFARLERETGRHVFPVFQYRFADHDPVEWDIVTRWRRDDAWRAGWRGSLQMALGGAMTSHGLHSIDLLVYRNGLPFAVEVMALLESVPETSMSALLFWSEKCGTVSVEIGPDVEPGGFRLGDAHTGFVNLFLDVHEALTCAEPMPITLSDARRGLEVLTACYYSAYSRTQVTLPLAPEHPFFHGWTEAFQRRAERP